MRRAAYHLTAAALSALGLTSAAPAQNAVTSPAPKVGASSQVLNDWLRSQSTAWTPWDVGGQFRARVELFDNASPANPKLDFQRVGVNNDNSYWWLREKVHLGYNADWFAVYTEGRDSRAWQDNDTKNLGQDPLELYQAYAILGNAKEFPLTVKVGRQELLYGDERLVGPSDWSNTGRVFDAVKLRWQAKDWWVDAFASHVVAVNSTHFNSADVHDSFFGVYSSFLNLVPIQESQFYFLSRNVDVGSYAGTKPRDIYTLGLRFKSLPGKLRGWDYSVEFVQQLGSINTGAVRLHQQANALAVAAGYTWEKTFATPRIGLEYDYSSGDNDPNDTKSETLDNLFPTNHKHYGTMDIVGWRNLHDVRVSLSAKPHKKLAVNLDYHLFWLANTHDAFYPQSGSARSGNGYGLVPGYSSFVGSELDLDVTYAITPWAGLRAGAGHFFTGGYIDASKAASGGAVDANWCYLQTTLSF